MYSCNLLLSEDNHVPVSIRATIDHIPSELKYVELTIYKSQVLSIYRVSSLYLEDGVLNIEAHRVIHSNINLRERANSFMTIDIVQFASSLSFTSPYK